MAVEGITELNKTVAAAVQQPPAAPAPAPAVQPMVTSQAMASQPLSALKPQVQPKAPSEDDPIKIELNVMKRYMRGANGPMFEKEKFYVFRRADARMLLKEKDDYGVSIWRLYRPPVPKAVVDAEGREGVKMSNFNMVELPKATPIEEGAIQVGSDEELMAEGIDLQSEDESVLI